MSQTTAANSTSTFTIRYPSTSPCFLASHVYVPDKRRPLERCEDCFAVLNCKMYATLKQVELTADGYAKLLGAKQQ